jgi:hypothetical protein
MILEIFLRTQMELSIYGLRSNYDRVGDAAWQPFSILTPNIEERLKDSNFYYFIIGRYFEDGSRIAIEIATNRIIRLLARKNSPTLSEWPDFSTMLTQEIKRIANHFDATGHLIDKNISILPKSHGME